MVACLFTFQRSHRNPAPCNEPASLGIRDGSAFHRIVFHLSMCSVLIAFLGTAVHAAELKPRTIEAWKRYEKLTEQRIAKELGSKEGFLVQDFLPEKDRNRCRGEVAEGKSCILKMRTKTGDDKKIKVPSGLIHHWMGSVRVPDAKLSDLLQWIKDYDKHDRYFDEVLKSRLLSREGDAFKIFYLLERKKLITVRYNTEHDVLYRLKDSEHASSASRATKIAELEEYGTPEQREKPAGHDSGYMWRLNSYWRFQQKGNDVVMSCESISLSRSIPLGLGIFIGRFVDSVPRESLESTLTGIRDGYVSSKSK